MTPKLTELIDRAATLTPQERVELLTYLQSTPERWDLSQDNRYPSLKLPDVYNTISFYLNHQQEVAEYLQQRQQQAQEIRLVNEQKFDPQGLRDRLLARRAEKSAE